uniref:Uncharacterized protein n=1 Tax=Romanomermis culicivorax TaxID=13658 RepID=A0A915IKK7_ROMCU
MSDQQLIPLVDNHTLRHDQEGDPEQNNTDNAAPPIQQQPQQQENMWSIFKKIAYRMIIFYLMSNLIRGFFQPSSINTASNATRSTTVQETPSRNLYQFMEHLDFYFYLSESSEKFDRFDDPQSLFWHVENFQYGDWYSGDNKDGCFSKSLSFMPSDRLKNNGSLYLHVFMTKTGFQPDPNKKSTYSKKFTHYKMHRLNKYRKKRYQKTTNLLTGKSEQNEEDFKKAEIMSAEILSHWHPNLTLNVITDQTNWIPGSVPPPLDEYIDFDESTKVFYYPPLYFNDYWNLAAEYQPINQTINLLNFTLTIAPISLFKWQLYAAQNMRNRWSKMLGSSSSLSSLFEDDDQQDDQDSLKQAMLDTNPYLLGKMIRLNNVRKVPKNISNILVPSCQIYRLIWY